jgi:CO/xanthine dehydrogenase FAD-binding subunit
MTGSLWRPDADRQSQNRRPDAGGGNTFMAAGSVDEALEALAGGARPIAGGTDLVVGARSGVRPLPDALVAIHALDELRALEAGEGGLRMGALVTHAAIEADAGVRAHFTALADASAIVGSHATRAQATIGGNLMNASPAMDTGGPLLCFAATATLRAAGGHEREVPLDALWTGPRATIAEPGELLTAVSAPAPNTIATGSAYVRLEYRRQMEIAVVGATAVVELDRDTVSAARIAITALAPTVRRVPEAEEALVGGPADRAAAERAGALAAAAAEPITDVRGSLEYRRAMAAVITRRAVLAAVARARGGAGAVPIPASPALHGAA